MDELKKQFKNNFNFSTKMIPLTRPYFHLQINDELFEQFNSQFVARDAEKSNYDHNYKRTFFSPKNILNLMQTIKIMVLYQLIRSIIDSI